LGILMFLGSLRGKIMPELNGLGIIFGF
jgi:hypothetical protein